MPASISPSRVGTSQQAGPRVQMIFVLRVDTSEVDLMEARVTFDPRNSGPLALVCDCMVIILISEGKNNGYER